MIRMSKTEWGTYQQIVATLEMADIVEIDRYDYKHFVMYWGIDNKNGRALCFHVYKGDDNYGKKQLQYLDEVVGGDLCRRNNLLKEAKSRGLTERSKEEQINEAKKGLDRVDVTNCNYDVITNNCEVHVTNWKYSGRGFSKQVKHTRRFKFMSILFTYWLQPGYQFL